MTVDQKRLKVERRRTEVGPMTIYSESAGQGAPLILIHGLAGSTRWWERNLEPLARHFQVHVLDLIGFGESRCKQPFVLAEAAAYLVRWMDCMGLMQASVVGHSMGGHIAAELAADFPERVSNLVLVDAAALPFDKAAMPPALDVMRTLPYLPFTFLHVIASDVQRAGLKTVMRAANELAKADISAKLAQIKARTLVIWGEFDPMIPLEFGKKLIRLVPCKEFAVIKDAGHNPMWDKPQIFNQVLISFLKTPRPRPHQRNSTAQAQARHI